MWHCNRAATLISLGRLDEAAATLATARALAPDAPHLVELDHALAQARAAL